MCLAQQNLSVQVAQRPVEHTIGGPPRGRANLDVRQGRQRIPAAQREIAVLGDRLHAHLQRISPARNAPGHRQIEPFDDDLARLPPRRAKPPVCRKAIGRIAQLGPGQVVLLCRYSLGIGHTHVQVEEQHLARHRPGCTQPPAHDLETPLGRYLCRVHAFGQRRRPCRQHLPQVAAGHKAVLVRHFWTVRRHVDRPLGPVLIYRLQERRLGTGIDVHELQVLGVPLPPLHGRIIVHRGHPLPLGEQDRPCALPLKAGLDTPQPIVGVVPVTQVHARRIHDHRPRRQNRQQREYDSPRPPALQKTLPPLKQLSDARAGKDTHDDNRPQQVGHRVLEDIYGHKNHTPHKPRQQQSGPPPAQPQCCQSHCCQGQAGQRVLQSQWHTHVPQPQEHVAHRKAAEVAAQPLGGHDAHKTSPGIHIRGAGRRGRPQRTADGIVEKGRQARQRTAHHDQVRLPFTHDARTDDQHENGIGRKSKDQQRVLHRAHAGNKAKEKQPAVAVRAPPSQQAEQAARRQERGDNVCVGMDRVLPQVETCRQHRGAQDGRHLCVQRRGWIPIVDPCAPDAVRQRDDGCPTDCREKIGPPRKSTPRRQVRKDIAQQGIKAISRWVADPPTCGNDLIFARVTRHHRRGHAADIDNQGQPKQTQGHDPAYPSRPGLTTQTITPYHLLTSRDGELYHVQWTLTKETEACILRKAIGPRTKLDRPDGIRPVLEERRNEPD